MSERVQINKIYVDMDGVLCDFEGQCHKMFPESSEYETVKEWSKKIGGNKFWKLIRSTEGRFWSEMEPTTENIVDVWQRMNNECQHISILSAPDGRDEFCIKGKNEWLDKHLGKNNYLRLFEPDKHIYSSPGSLLIDDLEKNAVNWEKEGGKVIRHRGVFDQDFWNEFHSHF